MLLYLRIMKKEYVASGIEELQDVVRELQNLMGKYQLFLLKGDLGAGKTTLVTQWMSEIGCKDRVSSPTFSIINEYRINGRSIYHMDLYRLNDIEEVYEIGINEYIEESSSWCLIEWPELYLPEIKEDYVLIHILTNSSQRLISIEEVRTH